jgi:hypothetical protein
VEVTAIIVTYGDRPLTPITDSLPTDWEVLIWDNGAGELARRNPNEDVWETIEADLPDLAVYGRYAAAQYATNDLCFTQDDDCVVDDPTAIVAALDLLRFPDGELAPIAVCNMPREFRHDFYQEHALVGFGAAFPRYLPWRIFREHRDLSQIPQSVFDRTCDIVFTGLTRRWLVDVPVRSLPYASDPNRMWKQPTHQNERAQVLEIVKSLAAEQAIA